VHELSAALEDGASYDPIVQPSPLCIEDDSGDHKQDQDGPSNDSE